MSIPAKTNPPATTIEDVITRGDLSKLTPEQRTEYYTRLCNEFGLSALTQPFDWLTLNGKLVLYANRRCADQLRKINRISIKIVSQDHADNLLSIHVQAKDKEGREDEDLGVVYLCYPDRVKSRDGTWIDHPKAGKPLQGDDRANTILKGITKAKRRVTLSIAGLGFLDETEVEDIPADAKAAPQIEPPTPAAAALIDIAAASPTNEVATDKPFDWIEYGKKMIAIAEKGEPFTPEQQAKMSDMQAVASKVYGRMVKAIARAQENAQPHPKKPPQPAPEDDPDAYRVWLIDQMSRFDTAADLHDFHQTQIPKWEPCFPPDIEDWEELFKDRAAELGK